MSPLSNISYSCNRSKKSSSDKSSTSTDKSDWIEKSKEQKKVKIKLPKKRNLKSSQHSSTKSNESQRSSSKKGRKYEKSANGWPIRKNRTNTVKAWACEHTDRKHKGHGLCDSCYWKFYSAKKKD